MSPGRAHNRPTSPVDLLSAVVRTATSVRGRVSYSSLFTGSHLHLPKVSIRPAFEHHMIPELPYQTYHGWKHD